MQQNPPYNRSQLSRAVNLAALLGWAAVAFPVFTTFNPLLWLASALIGLPLAFALCWLIGALVLGKILRKEVSWAAAALGGAAIAALIFAVYFVIRYLFISDLPEPYEWRGVVVDLMVFAVRGMVIGAAVRWATGPGQRAIADGRSAS